MSNWLSFWRFQKKFLDCTGPYAVGCTDFMCHNDDSGGVQGDAGSFIRFFYPTALNADIDETKTCHWIPRSEYTSGLVNFMKLPVWLLGSLCIPAVYAAPLYKTNTLDVNDASGLPCVVFSHGLGGNRFIYSTFCCELASQGCLVACVEHRDESASATFVLRKEEGSQKLVEEWIPYRRATSDIEFSLRNAQVHKRAAECINALNILEKINFGKCPQNLLEDHFCLQQLKGRLDLSKVAVVGHSFGGATAVTTLAKDKRFNRCAEKQMFSSSVQSETPVRCGVALDVWMLPLGKEVFSFEIDQPILFVNSQVFHRWKKNMDPLKKFISTKPDTRKIIAIRWTKHLNQCDIPSVLPPYLLRWTYLGSKLDQSTAVRLNRQAMWAFISRHLDIGNLPSHIPILDGGVDTPEHVVIGTELKDQSERKNESGVQSSL